MVDSQYLGSIVPVKPPLRISAPNRETGVHGSERKQPHGKPMESPSSYLASFIIPHMPHDLLFLSLRDATFRVERRSATPIAHILRQRLSDKEIYQLVSGFSVGMPAVGDEEDDSVDEASLVGLSEKAKEARQTRARFRAKIKEARIEHAVRLQKLGIMDVDISYIGPNEANEAAFVADKHAIAVEGGISYHWWPFDAASMTVAMSVIVRPATLDKLYPPERRERGIRIDTNTAPAAPDVLVPQKVVFKGTMFPYLEPTVFEDTPEGKEQRKKFIKDETRRICKDYERRGRTNSMEAIFNAPKEPWSKFSVRARMFGKLQPVLSPEALGEPSRSLDCWWLDDFETRRTMIENWSSRKRVQDSIGNFHRHLTDTEPTAVEDREPGVRYPLVSGLCDVYTESRDWAWYYSELVPDRKKKKRLAKLEKTEEHYAELLRSTEALKPLINQRKAEVQQFPNSLKAQRGAEQALRQEIIMYEQLEQAKYYVVKRRKKLGINSAPIIGRSQDLVVAAAAAERAYASLPWPTAGARRLQEVREQEARRNREAQALEEKPIRETRAPVSKTLSPDEDLTGETLSSQEDDDATPKATGGSLLRPDGGE